MGVRRTTAAIVVFACATASAQPGASERANTEPADGSPVQALSTGRDSPEVRAAYDRAFQLLLSEQWDAASAAFAQVAAQSVEAERRGAAIELGRFAHEMDEGGDDGPKRSGGRASFVVTTTLASFYTGFVLDDLLAVDDYKNQTMVVTGATFGGFAGALLGSRGHKITESMASAYASGLLIGAGNGLLLSPRLGIDVEDHHMGDGLINQYWLGFGLGTMVAGGAAGMYVADVYDPTPAQAQFAGLMGVNGFATVGLALVMIDKDPAFDYRNTLTMLAAGLDGGVVAGVVLGRDLTWSRSRLTYVTLAEFLGGLSGVAVGVLAIDKNGSNRERIGAGLLLGGIWGGFGLATHLTAGMTPDPRYRRSGPTVSLVPFNGDQYSRGIGVAGTF